LYLKNSVLLRFSKEIFFNPLCIQPEENFEKLPPHEVNRIENPKGACRQPVTDLPLSYTPSESIEVSITINQDESA
jgi:hypothetical protein